MPTTDTWQYADFHEQATDALILARLNLHITEVRQHVMGHASRVTKRFPVDPDYWKFLHDEKARLEVIVNPTSGYATNRVGVAKAKARFKKARN